jgi:hypothetical protein
LYIVWQLGLGSYTVGWWSQVRWTGESLGLFLHWLKSMSIFFRL